MFVPENPGDFQMIPIGKAGTMYLSCTAAAEVLLVDRCFKVVTHVFFLLFSDIGMADWKGMQLFGLETQL